MKMRVVSLILVLFMLAFTLASCGKESAEAGGKSPFEGRFASYYADNGLYVYVDKGTGVCYLWRYSGYKGGLTVMLDEDGRPLTYWEDGYDE